MERCGPSIFTSPECKSRHIFMLVGQEAVLDFRCVIGILLSPTVQSYLKVLSKSANSCEAGKSKGWINAAWTF